MEIIEKPLTTEKFTALASKTVRTGTKGNKMAVLILVHHALSASSPLL